MRTEEEITRDYRQAEADLVAKKPGAYYRMQAYWTEGQAQLTVAHAEAALAKAKAEAEEILKAAKQLHAMADALVEMAATAPTARTT